MSIEIEIKYRIADPAALVGRVEGMGGIREGSAELRDVYLVHPSKDYARTGEAFRIRSDGEGARLTYKGPRREGPAKTREEIEIGFVGEVDAMATLLDRLGFRVLAEVRKVRTSFRLEFDGREVQVVVDEAGALGTFAEVEAIAEVEVEVAEAQGAVIGLAGRLGLTEVEPRSYLRMTMERSGG